MSAKELSPATESLRFYGTIGVRQKFPKMGSDEAYGFVDEKLNARDAEILRNVAVFVEKFTENWSCFDSMKQDGIIGPHTMARAIHDELIRLAEATETGEENVLRGREDSG